MRSFLRTLAVQRWDDHRYYHHSRINQSLHLLSALSFLGSYVLLFTDPVAAALLGWLVAMVSRQVGHFFFEPKGYDQVNQATHEYKEEIKVGYNLQTQGGAAGDLGACRRWLLLPRSDAVRYLPAPCTGWTNSYTTCRHHVARHRLRRPDFRTVHLFFLKDIQTGLVWLTKILTDPFHDVMLYHRRRSICCAAS